VDLVKGEYVVNTPFCGGRANRQNRIGGGGGALQKGGNQGGVKMKKKGFCDKMGREVSHQNNLLWSERRTVLFHGAIINHKG